MDGCKPSQRKILYAALKRKLTSEIKVAQLSGYVSEHAAYHHGEASLQSTIVGMAQNFVGSNNLPLLEPNGQFGTRLLGGIDSASPRYIFTKLNPITTALFHPLDSPLLHYLDDDGFPVEPEYYVPILPFILFNGSKGIGTGYSTDIPNFNPLEVKNLVVKLINGESIDDIELTPYYRNFRGKIVKKSKGKGYFTKGIFRQKSVNTIEVTELPIGTWTENYKEFLDSILIDSKQGKKANLTTKQFINSYQNHSTENEVKFTIKMSTVLLNQMKQKGTTHPEVSYLEKKLNLVSSKTISNMHAYDDQSRIHKYTSATEIINHFYGIRLALYKKRKAYLIRQIQRDLQLLSARAQFIKDFIDSKIELRNRSKSNIKEQFETLNYPKLSVSMNGSKTKKNYDYLIKMSIYHLTKEKFEELMKARDVAQQQLDALQAKLETDMWLDDIAEFTRQYTRYLKRSC